MFPMITPTLSPFFTPRSRSPLATAWMCRSNSPKSHARCAASSRLRPRGPPCARAGSLRAMSAGRAACVVRMSSRKYAGRVLLISGGCVGPVTSESVSGGLGLGLAPDAANGGDVDSDVNVDVDGRRRAAAAACRRRCTLCMVDDLLRTLSRGEVWGESCVGVGWLLLSSTTDAG